MSRADGVGFVPLPVAGALAYGQSDKRRQEAAVKMDTYGAVLSKKAIHILRQHAHDDMSISSVRSFLYDMLDPTPDRGDMIYRYEHSVRVAENAAVIAEAEGLPKEDLIIACLLHDVGYRECREDFRRHPFYSADISRLYLEEIGYPPEPLQEMIRAIALHNLTDNLPGDMTAFQISVRDCDDIDRFDMIRTAMLLGDCVYEKTNQEIIASCNQAIDGAKRIMSLQRGTRTAQNMINENCQKRIVLLQDILAQAKKGTILRMGMD